MDSKPVGEAADRWNTDPVRPTIIDGNLYGPGSTDMKGACAGMVLAGAAVASVVDELAGSRTLSFTADKEYGSRLGAQCLARAGVLEVGTIILGQPSGVHYDWDAIRIVSHGFSGFRVIVRGTQTHSSISDQLPVVNAVEAMAVVMIAFRRELALRFPPHPLAPFGPTINIGLTAIGGVGYGVLPGHAEFWTDIRTLPCVTQQTLGEDIDAALARIRPLVPSAEVTWEFSPELGWLEPTEVAADHPAVHASRAACAEVLGTPPPLAAFPGASDAYPFQTIAGIPTIAALGPGLLPLAHGPNECISLRSLYEAVPIYALTALGYCRD